MPGFVTRWLASCQRFGQQASAEITGGPAFLLGRRGDLLVEAAPGRQVEALAESFSLASSRALGDEVVRRDTH